MVVETLKSIITRDLNKLKDEILEYTDETKIWMIEKNIANSAGNLCLHLVGNLNTFIGAQIGNTGYIRNRDREFSDKDVPRRELIQKIEQTIEVINTSFDQISDLDLEDEYPIQVFSHKTTTGYFLIHLASHLSYHLGQVNYHRRLLS